MSGMLQANRRDLQHPYTFTEYAIEQQTSGCRLLLFILMASIQAAAEPGL